MSSSRAPSNQGSALLDLQSAGQHAVGAVDDEGEQPEPEREHGVAVEGGEDDQQRERRTAGRVEVDGPGAGTLPRKGEHMGLRIAGINGWAILPWQAPAVDDPGGSGESRSGPF